MLLAVTRFRDGMLKTNRLENRNSNDLQTKLEKELN